MPKLWLLLRKIIFFFLNIISVCVGWPCSAVLHFGSGFVLSCYQLSGSVPSQPRDFGKESKCASCLLIFFIVLQFYWFIFLFVNIKINRTPRFSFFKKWLKFGLWNSNRSHGSSGSLLSLAFLLLSRWWELNALMFR